MEHLPFQTLEY